MTKPPKMNILKNAFFSLCIKAAKNAFPIIIFFTFHFLTRPTAQGENNNIILHLPNFGGYESDNEVFPKPKETTQNNPNVANSNHDIREHSNIT